MTIRLPAILLVALSVMCATELRAQSIFTIAGGGTSDGRPATLTRLRATTAVAVDSAGNLYIAAAFDDRIRKVATDSQIMTTVAGNGSEGFGGDGGPATAAALDDPWGVALDSAGNVYFADRFNDRIRKISAGSGIITTIAGNGSGGSGGDGGPATAAGLSRPMDVALDSLGNLYIAENQGFHIRKVSADSGIITTIAGNGSRGFSGDDGAATAAQLDEPSGVALDSAGNLYIADSNNHRIRKVNRNGIITTVAGYGERGFSGDGGHAMSARLSYPKDVALDSGGSLFISDGANNRIRKVASGNAIITTVAGIGSYGFSGDGGAATAAGLTDPHGVALDSRGNLYIADYGSGRVRRIAAGSEIITTVAGNGSTAGISGDGGPATGAELFPGGVALDSGGNLYIPDRRNHRIRKVASGSGIITTVAGNGSDGLSGDGGPATAAGLYSPVAVALDHVGNLYIADSNFIRKVSSGSGIITTIAGGGSGSREDGIPATTALIHPLGIALDAGGNLFFADEIVDIVTLGKRIRKISAGSGIITTVATSGFFGLHSEGVALDSAGNVYFTDTRHGWVRKIDAETGAVTTVAGIGSEGFSGDGGLATAAQLNEPIGVAFDSRGDLYIADSYNDRIRKVSAGIITTVAGTGSRGFSGDGGTAKAAGFSGPRGVVVDPAGNLYIADTDSGRVRAVFACIEIAKPALASPSNGASGVGTAPRLSWETIKGAFRYDVYLDTVSPPRTIVASDITTSTFAPANLEPLTTYYWKVVAKGDPFCEPFRTAQSPVWSFTTTGACQAPGAIVP